MLRMIAEDLRFHRWMHGTVRAAVVNRLRQIDELHTAFLVDTGREDATMPPPTLHSMEVLSMFSKILAVVLTAVVLTVGGYAYWQYADGHCCSTSTTTDPNT